MEAKENPFYWKSLEELKAMANGASMRDISQIPNQQSEEDNYEGIPDQFDPRDSPVNCIHPIRDQGECGSCWAHAVTEVLSDRLCIAGKNVTISVQDPVSCAPREQ